MLVSVIQDPVFVTVLSFVYDSLYIEKMAGGYSRIGDSVSQPPSYGTISGESSVEFFQACDSITNHLFTINNSSSSLERALKQIGTQADNQQLRNRITKIYSDAGNAVGETPVLLRTLSHLSRNEKQRKMRMILLQSEFKEAVMRYADVQKSIVDKLRVSKLPADVVGMEEDAAVNQKDAERLQVQKTVKEKEIQDLELEVAMQQEREAKVRSLEQDVININDIMNELSSLVSEQGALVDSIENNVESAQVEVEQGRDYLIKAAVSQNRYRHRCCIFTLILLIIFGVIAIVVALHFSK